MAARPEITPELARLIHASEVARARIGRDVGAFRQRLDAPAKVVQSLRHHPFRWLAGVAGVGFAAALVFRRSARPARKARGVRGLLLGLVAGAVRPLIKTWLTGQLRQLTAACLQAKSPAPAFSPNSSFPTRP
jgi:hypothetical protein